MEQARAEGNAIIDSHREALDKVFEDHKAEALRQSETRIKAETTNAKLALNQALAKSQLEIKRKQSKIQQELKDKIFEEAQDLIHAFMIQKRMTTSLYAASAVPSVLQELTRLRSISTCLMKRKRQHWKMQPRFI